MGCRALSVGIGWVCVFFGLVQGDGVGVCVDWGLGGCVVMERRWLSGILEGGFYCRE